MEKTADQSRKNVLATQHYCWNCGSKLPTEPLRDKVSKQELYYKCSNRHCLRTHIISYWPYFDKPEDTLIVRETGCGWRWPIVIFIFLAAFGTLTYIIIKSIWP